jgi:hypothetical protein
MKHYTFYLPLHTFIRKNSDFWVARVYLLVHNTVSCVYWKVATECLHIIQTIVINQNFKADVKMSRIASRVFSNLTSKFS